MFQNNAGRPHTWLKSYVHAQGFTLLLQGYPAQFKEINIFKTIKFQDPKGLYNICNNMIRQKFLLPRAALEVNFSGGWLIGTNVADPIEKKHFKI